MSGGLEPSYRTATLSGGFRYNMRRYVERVSGGPPLGRFLWEGTVLNLLGWLPTVLGSVLRGMAYRSILGGAGRGCFIEKHVHWQVPRRIFLGKRVMVGEGCFLDAGALTGRISLEDDIWLSRGCYLITSQDAEIQVGEKTYIGHRCLLYGHGGIKVGRNVLLANDVQLICGQHTFTRRDVSIRAQPTIERSIIIEDDVWLAASVIVLGGVTVGQGSVVGAGAVVTRNLPPYSVAHGVPARIVGTRGEMANNLEEV